MRVCGLACTSDEGADCQLRHIASSLLFVAGIANLCCSIGHVTPKGIVTQDTQQCRSKRTLLNNFRFSQPLFISGLNSHQFGKNEMSNTFCLGSYLVGIAGFFLYVLLTLQLRLHFDFLLTETGSRNATRSNLGSGSLDFIVSSSPTHGSSTKGVRTPPRTARACPVWIGIGACSRRDTQEWIRYSPTAAVTLRGLFVMHARETFQIAGRPSCVTEHSIKSHTHGESSSATAKSRKKLTVHTTNKMLFQEYVNQ